MLVNGQHGQVFLKHAVVISVVIFNRKPKINEKEKNCNKSMV